MSNPSGNEFESALTYSSYLAVDELLELQRPLSQGPEDAVHHYSSDL
jgi:tryptophan 2,3-dioxygenase